MTNSNKIAWIRSCQSLTRQAMNGSEHANILLHDLIEMGIILGYCN